jgi:hypothetical protein
MRRYVPSCGKQSRPWRISSVLLVPAYAGLNAFSPKSHLGQGRPGKAKALFLSLTLTVTSFAGARAGAIDVKFSVDPASPAINGNITPDDVLTPGPLVYIHGRSLGLQDNFFGGVFDNLTDFSFGKDSISNPLYFSVDRVSVGLPGTAVFDEAAPGVASAAGDVFVALPPASSNALFINGASLGLTRGFFGDDVDGLSLGSEPTPNTYFAIDRLSASNDFGNGSLASDLLVSAGDGHFAIYATNSMMGLDPGDGIDGLVLHVANLDQVGDPGIDMALFSLDPFSPDTFTFTGLPYMPCVPGRMSPADVCFTDFTGTFSLWASAADLGLRPDDNIDALATIPEPSTVLLVVTGALVFLSWRALSHMRRFASRKATGAAFAHQAVMCRYLAAFGETRPRHLKQYAR